jgi:preprotein translocase subunit SecE
MTQHSAKRSGLRFRFISETIAELKKVVWLTRREVLYLTALVLITAVSVGAVLGLLDWGFSSLTKLILG